MIHLNVWITGFLRHLIALNLTFIYLMISELLLANSAVLIINYHQKKVDFGGLQEMTGYLNFVIQLNWGMNIITSLIVPT